MTNSLLITCIALETQWLCRNADALQQFYGNSQTSTVVAHEPAASLKCDGLSKLV